jgi:hypothetical protein
VSRDHAFHMQQLINAFVKTTLLDLASRDRQPTWAEVTRSPCRGTGSLWVPLVKYQGDPSPVHPDNVGELRY